MAALALIAAAVLSRGLLPAVMAVMDWLHQLLAQQLQEQVVVVVLENMLAPVARVVQVAAAVLEKRVKHTQVVVVVR